MSLRSTRPFLLGAGLLVLAACDAAPAVALNPEPSASTTAAASPAPQSTAAANASLAKKLFGEPITEQTETSLASIASQPDAFVEKTIRTTGKVTAVCKKAGCWMEIGDETSRAHIKMSGHSFFVPKDSDGKTAVVQGVVKGGEPKNECGSKDSCGGEENGAIAKVEIVATGIELVD